MSIDSRRFAVLRGREFRLFFLGYTVSLSGSSMASVALAFAVLAGGGGGGELGLVMAARILPIVLMLLLGGAFADRLGSRRVILGADAVRCLTQAALAVVLLGGRHELPLTVALVAVWGAAEAAFMPALGALVPALVPAEALSDANALLGIARSSATVAGPALAGLLTAVLGPSAVLAVDSAGYAIGFAALALVRVAAPPTAAGASLIAELREGWEEFRSRTWLWLTSLQVCLFNLLVWAPFLVLGPLVSVERLGGARTWGLVMAVYGAGSVLGGLLLLGRRPRRPLLLACAATAGWALPSAALAAGGSVPWICFGALAAGVASIVSGTLVDTLEQQSVPPEALARVNAYGTLGAFAFGPLGLAAAGPLADALGTSTVLGAGAAWQVLSTVTVLAVLALLGRRTPAPDLSPHLREPRPAPSTRR